MSITLKTAQKKDKEYVMPTYGLRNVVFEKGDGCYLYDNKGNKYLDMLAGIAVSSLGYKNKNLINAIKKQSEKLLHTSNLFYTEPQIIVAEKLSKLYKNGKVFFCNSGAEANEAAIKLIRKYFLSEKKYEIITLKNSFHGRTLTTITATGQSKYQTSFKPLPTGFKYAEINNIDSVKKLITKKTAAIMIEFIQCEGGINICNKKFINGIKKLCKQHNLLLIADEVQTGIGRTGKFFAYEHYNVKPDIVSLAKGIAGGLPMGVIVADKKIADSFQPGDHASTFGGGPLVCAASNEVLKFLNAKKLKEIIKTSEYFIEKLNELKKTFSLIKEIRGLGFIIAIELKKETGNNLKEKLFENGVIVNCIKNKIIRLVPPLILTKKEINIFITKLKLCFKE